MTTNFFSEREIKKLDVPQHVNPNHPVAKYLLSLGKMARHGAKGRLDTVAQLLEPASDCWNVDWTRVDDELTDLIRQKMMQNDNSLQAMMSERAIDKHLATVQELLHYVEKPTPPVFKQPLFSECTLSAILATCDKDLRYGKKLGVRDAAVIAALATGLTPDEVAELKRSDYNVDAHELSNQVLPDELHARMVRWLNLRSGIKNKTLFLSLSIHGYLSNQPLVAYDVVKILNDRQKKSEFSKPQ